MMDSVGVESCSTSSSSSSSSHSSASFNLTAQVNRSDVAYSSNSSEASVSPNQISGESSSCRRRPNHGSMKDEAYWEKRKRNNDAAKRSREKRRINDLIMEQRLIELTNENNLLRSKLNNHDDEEHIQLNVAEPDVQSNPLTPNDGVIVSKPKFSTLPISTFPTFPVGPSTLYPTTLLPSSSFINSLTASTPSPQQMLQLCHLQTKLSYQYRNLSSSTISTGCGAFQPFQSVRDEKTAKFASNSVQRSSPDSSTSDIADSYTKCGWNDSDTTNINKNIEMSDGAAEQSWNSVLLVQDPNTDQENKPQSLLGSLLSSRRKSPLVQQSQTDIQSGLNSSPNHSNDLKKCLNATVVNSVLAKSDTESLASPSSNNSSSDSASGTSPSTLPAFANSAIVEALNSTPANKHYIDRRRRNNEAAKRCRANRRAQFEYRSKRAQQLEQENDELRKETNRLKQELEHLKAMQAAKNAVFQQN